MTLNRRGPFQHDCSFAINWERRSQIEKEDSEVLPFEALGVFYGRWQQMEVSGAWFRAQRGKEEDLGASV